MALTPFRWAAMALTGMLLVFLAVMREGRPYQPTSEQLRLSAMSMRSSHHGRRVAAFTTQYRMAELTDSLRRAIPATSIPVRTIFAANVDLRVRVPIDSAVAQSRVKIGERPLIPVDVVTLVDTTSVNSYRAWASSLTPFYILPSRPTDRCVVVIPIGYENAYQYVRTMYTEDARRQILGPCAYYAAFGLPGASVREWLRLRGALLALGGSWTRNTQASDGRQYESYLSANSYFPGPPPSFFLFSNRGVNCLVGDAETCESLVLERSIPTGQQSVGSAVRLGYRLGPISQRNGAELGGRETELLADMLRSLGRERFARFWTSNQPVPQAFEQASGMRLGEWVSTWAAQSVARYDSGPKIPATSLVSALGIVIACVLFAVFAARRRVFA